MRFSINWVKREECTTVRIESSEDLRDKKSRKEGVEEELWCKSLLQSWEMELTELNHVSFVTEDRENCKKKSKLKKKVIELTNRKKVIELTN